MKQYFRDVAMNAEKRRMITAANQILSKYARQGYDLSLRQLYYQFVSANLITNEEKSYKKLGTIISDARDAGLIDWNMIVDRGRSVSRVSTWSNPADILDSAAASFKIDLWQNQPVKVLCLVEKQALEGVLEPVCLSERIEFSANKGYASASHLYTIARKIRRALDDEKDFHVIYLGDHDPSGIDMGRDVLDRLNLYSGQTAQFEEYETSQNQVYLHRVALNMEQIRQYNPPPNPAKMTDTRASGYVKEFGNSSWELDALTPSVLADIVRSKIEELRDEEQWAEDVKKENKMISDLLTIAAEYREANPDG